MRFNPDKLVFARELRGYSQKQLADKLEVSSRTIHHYENGEYIPDIEKLSETLSIEKEFFYGNSFEEISSQKVSFRALSKMTQRVERQVNRNLETAIEFNDWLESKFDLIKADLPDLSLYEPQAAAIELREQWGLSNRPIGDMIALLEKHGIRVFSLNIPDLALDACCTWRNDTPFVFLNLGKSAERVRFDAAHELGHLVMDVNGFAKGKTHRETEKAMNEFASAFLMPKDTVQQRTPEFITVDDLITLKKNWKVSVAALAYRMQSLGLVSEWVYSRVLSPEMSKRGYRTEEPEGIPMETSTVLTQIAEILKEDKISLKMITKEIGATSVNDISSFLFDIDFMKDYELSVVHNKGTVVKSSHKKPTLTIVK
ncbi:XRE family transcriptional regulator [Ignatzschineria rhizosphaerae]|uniref:XRE family transcriptional regulator n=1 Tax=Ignatzschineria rhizosphaerae TaxID=2923279 RepID=A0ABY3X450_9GAMM|nr:XRE family transcriptional regulator [Ignatzschineria rhizosphaerae]UNM96655.1 XRE family transcriptional regulator [Ignatzschineria rhizosphaerae]